MNKFKQIFRIFSKLAAASKVILALCIYTSCFAHSLPDLGNEFRSVISIEDEKLIGEIMMSEIRAAGLSHPDPLVNEYIKHVGNKLTPYMTIPYNNIQMNFFAINDSSINAFAFFGGNVAIHSGLIKATESESELAGVMAHELAHISQQHVLRQIADNKRMMPVTIAESIAAIVIGVPELVLTAWAGHAQNMLNYSRQYEQEADRLGLQILSKANFDPQGLPNILQRMSLELRYHNKPPEYLLTHPLFESRLSDTRNRANSLTYKKQSSSHMFQLVKARIAVQSAANLQHFLEDHEHILKTQRYNNKLAADYTYAYALLLKGTPDKAWHALSPLISAYPADLIIQMTAAEIEVQEHRIADAIKRMQHLAEIFPDSPAVLLQYSEFLIRAQKPQQAKAILNKYRELHQPEPVYYDHIRNIEGMLGNQAAIYEANAEWFALHGDLHSALAQLNLGLTVKNQNKKTISRIKNRQKELSILLERRKNL